MKFTVTNQFSQNIPKMLRRCGYMPIHDRISGQDSFSRKLSTGHYPRFHLYVKTNGNNTTFDLHLDQNENRYQGQKAHNADYDSDQVKNELTSVYHQIVRFHQPPGKNKPTAPSPLDIDKTPPKRGWLERLLGR